MSYQFTRSDIEFLVSAAGEQALAQLRDLDLSGGKLVGDLARVRAEFPDHFGALVSTVRARRSVSGKLDDAATLLLTDEAAQQATASAIARHRAGRIGTAFPGAAVHDVTCSVGAELLELEKALIPAIGSDLDEIRLQMARYNCAAALLVRADAVTETSTAPVVIADPARRTGAGRTFRFEDLRPGVPELLATYAGRQLVIKCAPGLDYRMVRQRFGFAGEVEVVSLDGGVKEACLWAADGPGIVAGGRRATVLRSDGSGFSLTDSDPDDIAVGDVGKYLIDPDGAVVRAGLVRHYGFRHRLWQLDPQIAYLTGDAIPPGQRAWPVIEELAMHERKLRTRFHELGCGSLEIAVRGVDVDPDRLRKALRLKGNRPMAVVIARVGRQGRAFICDPAVRTPL